MIQYKELDRASQVLNDVDHTHRKDSSGITGRLNCSALAFMPSYFSASCKAKSLSDLLHGLGETNRMFGQSHEAVFHELVSHRALQEAG